MCFSGGKDSVLALHAIQRQRTFRVEQLLTTVTAAYDRVSMHGVRRTLLREQAASLGLPLTEVAVPPDASNAAYERAMGLAFEQLPRQGIRRVVFGDIFLADLRAYREQQLAASELECLFPLWQRDTAALPRDVDPCGENGEFHTCVFDGPIFRWPITVSPGEVVTRDGFVFCDLVSSRGDDQSRRAQHEGGTPC